LVISLPKCTTHSPPLRHNTDTEVDMMDDVLPANQLAIDAAVIVSETDAAHSGHSSDEEAGWLATTAVSQRARSDARRLQSGDCDGLDWDNAGEGAASGSAKPNASNDDDSDDDDDVDGEAAPDQLYCSNMDDEDEAWVYKHMRSGQEELVYVRQRQQQKEVAEGKTGQPNVKGESGSGQQDGKTGNDGQSNTKQETPVSQNQQIQQALLLKPRSSDAILSCPRCFTTVCMDCQEHERYAGQYRAMFVMNIGVDWNKRMVYDEAMGGLKLASAGAVGRITAASGSAMQADGEDGEMDEDDAPDTIPHDHEKDELYYSVHCGYCQHELAVLDMGDEIYYFFGCIASS
jgi:hypothetical protein